MNQFKRNITKTYLIRLFMWMHFIAAVLVPFYIKWGHITFSQIFILNAWFMLWNFIFEIPTGTIADFVSRKFSIALGCFVGAFASVFIVFGYIIYSSYVIFLIGEVLFALSFALVSGADEALIYDSLKEAKEENKSKEIFGKMESFKLAGILLGALSGSIIAKYFGLSMPVVLMALPFSLAGFVALTLKEPEKKELTKKLHYATILKDGILYFLKHRTLKILALDMVVINSIAWIIIWVYQQLLALSGLDIVYFGVVHSLMTIGQIYLILNFRRVEQLLNSKKNVLFLTSFITGLLFVFLAFFKFLPVVIVLVVLISTFGLSRMALFSNYMNKYVESDKRATVLSTVSMFRTLGIVILNSIVGFLLQWSIYKTLFILGALTILFSFVSRVEEEYLID